MFFFVQYLYMVSNRWYHFILVLYVLYDYLFTNI